MAAADIQLGYKRLTLARLTVTTFLCSQGKPAEQSTE